MFFLQATYKTMFIHPIWSGKRNLAGFCNGNINVIRLARRCAQLKKGL